MSQLHDSILQIVNEALQNSTGSLTHTGDYTINGTITADTINVKQLTTESGNAFNVGNWAGNTESDINGKGFNWTWAEGNTRLIYRSGRRLWTDGMFDVDISSSYNIDNVPVLYANTLGGTITTSSLTKLGKLQSLAVSGDTVLGDFAFFNSSFNRFGIGVEEPSAAINILDGGVDIVLGSQTQHVATFGTNSNHDLSIVTDGLNRVTVKHNGVVNIGDPASANAVLNVYGVINATSIQTDNRIDRAHPLQFTASRDSSIYGLGLVWAGTGATRQLIMMGGPDRLFTTESIDIGENQCYYLNGVLALGSNTLGPSITNSNITKLGALQSLQVSGPSEFIGDINAIQSAVKAQSIEFSNGTHIIKIDSTGVNSTNNVNFKVQEKEVLYGDAQQINIGDKTLQNKPVKVFGPLSVNINNPDPTLQFAVAGDVSIGGKRFTSSHAVPNAGTFEVGDICWNNQPGPGSYVGWVCVTAGSPGHWFGFGLIGN